jgi:hypothetical protein
MEQEIYLPLKPIGYINIKACCGIASASVTA